MSDSNSVRSGCVVRIRLRAVRDLMFALHVGIVVSMLVVLLVVSAARGPAGRYWRYDLRGHYADSHAYWWKKYPFMAVAPSLGVGRGD